MITIRLANTNDTASISSIGKSTFDYYYKHLFENVADIEAYLETAFKVEKIHKSLNNSGNKYWIAHDTVSNMIIGYAKLQLHASTELIKKEKGSKLQRIYVLPSFVSSGIGARLEKHILNMVKDIGNEYLWLSTLKSNKKALLFYEREGYEIVGEDFFTIGKQTFEHWVFAKSLIEYPIEKSNNHI